MAYFVSKHSIVRKIWGKSDTILFIFAGAAAEFALNKAVDWLYFTGRLPADPLGRLFSTVEYARRIVFAELPAALKAIDQITQIHTAVEKARGGQIPDWAYRDVLFMLIHYSIAAYEVLEKKLTADEKQEVYSVFRRMGERMHLTGLPPDYVSWLAVREQHMKNDLQKSGYTQDLFLQYRKHLGQVRYQLLLQGQILVVPSIVAEMLGLNKHSWLKPVITLYKISRVLRLDGIIKAIVLPKAYQQQINQLDQAPQPK